MKNQKRLSLDAFKEKANSVTNEEVMKNIQGGGWTDCHGLSGELGKLALISLVYGSPA